MIKPKILSDAELDIVTSDRRKQLETQNDYCYKEMLGQFEGWMRTLLHDPESQDCRGAIGFIGLTILGELLALQGLEKG